MASPRAFQDLQGSWRGGGFQAPPVRSREHPCSLLQTADRQYMEGFNDELEAFKDRVRGRAKLRIEKAMKEYEEEERKKRLGPGGLDPVEVYESLPEVRSPWPLVVEWAASRIPWGPGNPGHDPIPCTHRNSRNALMRRTFRCSKTPSARWTPP